MKAQKGKKRSVASASGRHRVQGEGDRVEVHPGGFRSLFNADRRVGPQNFIKFSLRLKQTFARIFASCTKEQLLLTPCPAATFKPVPVCVFFPTVFLFTQILLLWE